MNPYEKFAVSVDTVEIIVGIAKLGRSGPFVTIDNPDPFLNLIKIKK